MTEELKDYIGARRFGLSDEEALSAVSAMTVGAGPIMKESKLSPADVIDLVPVRPLAENEEDIKKIYETKLTAIYTKLTI